MKRPTLIILTILTTILLIAAGLIFATEYGSISGQITDSQTQQPIVGASVLLVGTSRGDNTDLEGKFVIKRVEPGTYTIRISAFGYQELELKNVEVKTDLTVSIKNSLTEKTESLDEKIVVEAQIDIIDKFGPSNQTTITKDIIEHKPVQTVDEIMDQATGVRKTPSGKVYQRGGRPVEVTYLPDGVVRDAPTCYYPPQIIQKKAKRETYYCFPPPYVPIDSFDDMFFQNYGVNPFINTDDDYQSTFAIDIDDASYTLCRSYLEQSALPPADAIRVEEFINHFDYKYQPPANETFAVYMEGAPSRFGQNSQLLRIGIKGKNVDDEVRRPANLVFVVDVSGSMQRENRIVLVQKTLRLLTDQLYYNDCIGIVAYNQSANVILEPTPLRQKGRILAALERLIPGGSTNCQAGLQLGFQMAVRHFESEKSNRVFLFSDGVANVGNTDPEALLREMKRYTDRGITLSTIGVGMGNYNDVLMEKLGDKGNGFYAYIDDMDEARRVFEGNLVGALQVIARDVKIKVEFDPELVQSYRLLGYENRAVADYNFRNDKVDGGEVGPGHSATALYEINLKSARRNWFSEAIHSENIGRVFVRYNNPQTGSVEEINKSIPTSTLNRNFSRSTPHFKLAAVSAEFAEIMRDSYWAKNSSLNDVLQLANEVYHLTADKDVLELVNLISKARDLRNIESDYFSKE